MPDYHLSVQRGTKIALGFATAPLDLTQPGSTAVFTAKRHESDAAPLLQKRYVQAGGGDAGTSATADTLTVELQAIDTAETPDAFSGDEFLVFDVIANDDTLIAKGDLTVLAGAGS